MANEIEIETKTDARKLYETVFVVDPEGGEEATRAIVDKFLSLIAGSGEVVRVEEWGKRDLAYPIHDRKKGYYVLVYFRANADFPAELNRVYNITEGLLRSLTVRSDEKQLKKRVEEAAAEAERRAAAAAAREAAAKEAAEAAAAEAAAAETTAAEAAAAEAESQTEETPAPAEESEASSSNEPAPAESPEPAPAEESHPAQESETPANEEPSGQ